MQNEPLFREEVLDERRTQQLGTVLLAPRLSHRVFAAFAAVSTLFVLGMLFFADYTRKARIDGWLVPHHGLVQVFVPRSGVITQLYAEEGSEVRKGDPLLVLSAEVQSSALGATQTAIARQLAAQRASLEEQRSQLDRLTEQRRSSIGDRLRALELELAQLDREIGLQQDRLRLSEQAVARQQELEKRGLASEQDLSDAQAEKLDQDSRVGSLERLRISNRRVRLSLEGELANLPLESDSERASIERQIAALEQQLAEAEAQREIVVPAPESGTVTAIQAERGGRPSPNVPLLSIVPADSELVAHMFSPTRAIGFLRPGQRVLLRYHAYPYQKFGHHAGVVASISRSAVNPSELPAHLAGLTSLVGSNEPVYRITVSLERQTVMAYGEAVSLQPGMQLEADVLIEKRRLIEWVLDPLYTLTGKWQG